MGFLGELGELDVKWILKVKLGNRLMAWYQGSGLHGKHRRSLQVSPFPFKDYPGPRRYFYPGHHIDLASQACHTIHNLTSVGVAPEERAVELCGCFTVSHMF